MGKGIETTLRVLGKSKNKSAAKLLDAALASSLDAIRKPAGHEIISSRSGRGISELIRRFSPGNEEFLELIQEHRAKWISPLRAAIVSKDRELSRNALRIANTQKFFELIPSLLEVYMDRGEESDGLDDTIMKMVVKYAAALEERRNRRFLHGQLLPEVLKSVSKGIKDFHRNDPVLVLKILIAIYPYIPEDEKVAIGLFRSPMHPAYQSLYRLLLTGNDSFLYAFVFYCLDNDDPEPLAVSVFSKRTDSRFLSFFFKKVLESFSGELKRNLEKLPAPAWLGELEGLLPGLDADAQRGLVLLVRNMNLPRSEIQVALLKVFAKGKTGGRLDALSVLAEEPGEFGERFLWNATEVSDPEVRIAALNLLRKKNVPKATSRILRYVDSPDESVRKAVRNLLPEFRFSRFLETFDLMNETQRQAMFHLVQKVDPQTIDELARMLVLGDPMDKAKALLCVGYGDLSNRLEESLCVVLAEGETPLLRAKAAELLAHCRRELSRGALVQAFHRDPAPEVRDAARTGLEKRPAPWEVFRAGKEDAKS